MRVCTRGEKGSRQELGDPLGKRPPMDDTERRRLLTEALGYPPALRRALACHLRAFGELRNERLVIAAGRRQSTWAKHAAQQLLEREFVRRLVSANGACLISLPREWQQDLEIASIAVRNYPGALLVAPNELLADKALVLSAVGWLSLLERIPPALRDDADVVAALCRDGWGLSHASERLRRDADFVLRRLSISALQELERKPVLEALLVLEENRKNTGHLLRAADVLPDLPELERLAAEHRVRVLLKAAAEHGYKTFPDPVLARNAAKGMQKKFADFTLGQIERAIQHDWNAGYR